MRISFRPEHTDGQLGWGYYNHQKRLVWVNKTRVQKVYGPKWRPVLAVMLAHELAHWLLSPFVRPYRSVYDVYKEELLCYRAQGLVAKLMGIPLVEGFEELGAQVSTASTIHQLKRGATL